MTEFAGELAAVATAVCFSVGTTFFALAGQEVSAMTINRIRLLLGVVFVAGLHWLILGELWPTGVATSTWLWLALSGLIGLALGDASRYQAFRMIGPRLTSLIMALTPALAALLAWLFLDESLSAQELLGILVTLVGIGWVISERQQGTSITTPRTYMIGVLFALGGAIGQATGLITAKFGLVNDFPALSANLIRLVVATVIVWGFTAIQGGLLPGVRALQARPRALRMMIGGTVIGPTVGVWLSLIAVQRAPVGIASTLMSLTPIFLIPIAFVVFHEKVSRRAIVGTLIAFVGTALLFL